MTADLLPLIAELDIWHDHNAVATFWWRDDDASAPCAELDALLQISAGRPLALATVPFNVGESLVRRLASEPHVTIFQHGWKHQNHAAKGPNSEYPSERSIKAVGQEFVDGITKLRKLFGDQFAPVFTPPWHGLDSGYLPLLASTGIRGLSAKGRRSAPMVAGLLQNNIHCVPIQWADPPGFDNPSRYVRQLVDHLTSRRAGHDPNEATGILTHHLVQPRESLVFVSDLLDLIESHRGARLSDPREIFCGDLGRVVER